MPGTILVSYGAQALAEHKNLEALGYSVDGSVQAWRDEAERRLSAHYLSNEVTAGNVPEGCMWIVRGPLGGITFVAGRILDRLTESNAWLRVDEHTERPWRPTPSHVCDYAATRNTERE